MKELIQIHNGKDTKTVSAKQLYDFLGLNKAAWKRWYTKNILKNPYAIENEDWKGFNLMLNGNETQDFEITLDFAKKISMQAKTDKGEQARNYFIECEKQLQQPQPQPALSQAEILLQSVQLLVNQQKEIDFIKTEVQELKARQITSPDGFYAIAGYASLISRRIDLKTAATLGKKAMAMCRQLGYITGIIGDPRFGKVRTYPKDVLESVFTDFFGITPLKAVK